MSETISAKNIMSSLKKLAKSSKGSSINEGDESLIPNNFNHFIDLND